MYLTCASIIKITELCPRPEFGPINMKKFGKPGADNSAMGYNAFETMTSPKVCLDGPTTSIEARRSNGLNPVAMIMTSTFAFCAVLCGHIPIAVIDCNGIGNEFHILALHCRKIIIGNQICAYSRPDNQGSISPAMRCLLSAPPCVWRTTGGQIAWSDCSSFLKALNRNSMMLK